ncbi:MAG: hypothetical protein ACRDJ9_25010 [Dehalococcoidia bacterium]
MTETENLVLEILRRIQADVAQLNEGQKGLRVEIAAIEQQLGALTTAVYAGHDRVRELEQRIERLERHLEITQ